MTADPTRDRLEERVLDAVDREGLVETVRELIAIDSSGGRETPVQEAMARHLRSRGMEVDVWELDLQALARDPAFSMEIERDHALGVVGRAGSGDGPTLVLNGHVDVVPAGEPERWSVPPFAATVKDGQLLGRGAADMKGGLCCALFAVDAILSLGIELRGSVLIQSVVGEEDGGVGTLAAVRRGHTGDGAVVLEPTELVVAPAQAGAFNFRVTLPGRAAHGALRGEGVNPIEKLPGIYAALLSLEADRNRRPRHPLFRDLELPYALCVGTLSAGIWASTVPESLVFEGRLGIAPDEDPDAARRELADAVAEAAREDPWLRDHPPVLEWWGGQFGPAAIPADHPIVTTLAGAHLDVTGHRPAVRGMPYGADMRLLVNEGATPTVLYGPGDVRHAHAPDERVAVDDLMVATRVLALSILRFCGV